MGDLVITTHTETFNGMTGDRTRLVLFTLEYLWMGIKKFGLDHSDRQLLSRNRGLGSQF